MTCRYVFTLFTNQSYSARELLTSTNMILLLRVVCNEVFVFVRSFSLRMAYLISYINFYHSSPLNNPGTSPEANNAFMYYKKLCYMMFDSSNKKHTRSLRTPVRRSNKRRSSSKFCNVYRRCILSQKGANPFSHDTKRAIIVLPTPEAPAISR